MQLHCAILFFWLMTEKSCFGQLTAKSLLGFGRLKEGKRVDLPKLFLSETYVCSFEICSFQTTCMCNFAP